MECRSAELVWTPIPGRGLYRYGFWDTQPTPNTEGLDFERFAHSFAQAKRSRGRFMVLGPTRKLSLKNVRPSVRLKPGPRQRKFFFSILARVYSYSRIFI